MFRRGPLMDRVFASRGLAYGPHPVLAAPLADVRMMHSTVLGWPRRIAARAFLQLPLVFCLCVIMGLAAGNAEAQTKAKPTKRRPGASKKTPPPPPPPVAPQMVDDPTEEDPLTGKETSAPVGSPPPAEYRPREPISGLGAGRSGPGAGSDPPPRRWSRRRPSRPRRRPSRPRRSRRKTGCPPRRPSRIPSRRARCRRPRGLRAWTCRIPPGMPPPSRTR
ncbi:hypothetical protein STIAU_0142 [Stigmatella aurantiaca DW4/3-1]|uniref:Uncharacterized protein n=1 Tax=Stigmatella aurantiaca (strain DW4/3-1) TaxID=378806 RepID=Q08TT5_STIAD|nr:hypothetical protein STIAU_0142 [Stigmatella aurantiaca DW4/3-1]